MCFHSGLLHFPNYVLLMVHLETFTYCPMDPDYVFWQCLVYMFYGTRLDSWMPSLCVQILEYKYIFSLGSSLQIHLLNNLIYVRKLLKPFKPIFSNMPNILLICLLYRNWLIPLIEFSMIFPIFLNIGHWDSYVPLIHIVKDLLGSSQDM